MRSAPGWLHSLSPRLLRAGRGVRLVQTLLVRDEVEAIADNLRVHAALGVDAFVVMDNGSTDGTREALEQLRSELELQIIDRPERDYRQSAWKTELAFEARRRFAADWTFNGDADELWLPRTDSLKDVLPRAGTVLECPRSNHLHVRGLEETTPCWFEAPLRVHCPLVQTGVDVLEHEDVHLHLGTIKPKVLVNAHGLVRVKGGNHRAWHLRAWRGPRPCPAVHVAHFPMRSWNHFERHVVHRVRLLDAGITRMGVHYKRWARMWREGTLEREYRRLLIGAEEERVLTASGVLGRDLSVAARVRTLLGSPPEEPRPVARAAAPAGDAASRGRPSRAGA